VTDNERYKSFILYSAPALYLQTLAKKEKQLKKRVDEKLPHIISVTLSRE
jgi:hypothetical protein